MRVALCQMRSGEDVEANLGIAGEPRLSWCAALAAAPIFCSAARAQPGVLNYGTAGVGSIAHLATELLERKYGSKYLRAGVSREDLKTVHKTAVVEAAEASGHEQIEYPTLTSAVIGHRNQLRALGRADAVMPATSEQRVVVQS